MNEDSAWRISSNRTSWSSKTDSSVMSNVFYLVYSSTKTLAQCPVSQFVQCAWGLTDWRPPNYYSSTLPLIRVLPGKVFLVVSTKRQVITSQGRGRSTCYLQVRPSTEFTIECEPLIKLSVLITKTEFLEARATKARWRTKFGTNVDYSK